MSRRLFILGSTGSIGKSAIDVIQHLRSEDGEGSWPVIGLAAATNSELLLHQAESLNAEAVSLCNGSDITYKNTYQSAEQLLIEHATEGDLVLVAIVGFAGISPTLQAVKCGCDIALANKETLVAGGALVMQEAKNAGVQIIPVDSEHSAIFQAISNHPKSEVEKITLTASGGSLRDFTDEKLHSATVEQVLDHPTWDMGAKVTVDSASLMNKALELIEAHWLFGVEGERLHALIHPQSIVHGMVEFVDGSVLAHLAMPDMKIPIQHALTYPNLRKGIAEQINWSQLSNLEFEEINHDRYGAIQLAYDVISRGGTAGAVFNAANEVVVNSFLQNALPFGSIIAIVEEVLKRAPIDEYIDFNSLVKADHETRELTTALIAALKVHS